MNGADGFQPRDLIFYVELGLNFMVLQTANLLFLFKIIITFEFKFSLHI